MAAPIAQEVKRELNGQSLESPKFRSYLSRAYALQGDLERAEGLIKEIRVSSESFLKGTGNQVGAAALQRVQDEALHDALAEYAVALARAKRFPESRSVLDSAQSGIVAVAHHRPLIAATTGGDSGELTGMYGWLCKLSSRAKIACVMAGLVEASASKAK